ncbi:MAG: PIN domain-containing protein [Acidobacteria bacterium]|nr:PIN domain-containing protein [Acidobacteriota bacterium]MBI3423759.1 PIN domain-containing protein [Acidobacteriota bacterium]
MKLLLDTNVFAEVMFRQRQAAVAQKLLDDTSHELFITTFALFSIGLLLFRRGYATYWPRFINDLIASGRVQVVSLAHQELATLLQVAQQLSLDFDDAYQYVAAENYGLTLVSFDGDFDHTPHGRQTPQAILQLRSQGNI